MNRADSCGHCRATGRPTRPLAPMFVELTSDGWRADYLCPMPACLHGWYATWHPDVVDADDAPERAA